MQVIPLNDVYSQTFSVSLADQNVTLTLYQKSTGVFCDVYLNDALVIGGVICQNLNRIVRNAYLGFVGDLMFNDTTGTSDPSSPGLGTRFLLYYLTASEVGGDE